MSESPPPSVLVLGGVGMIGRNFVKYLVESGGAQLVSHIRVVDRRLPVMADFTEEFRAIFASPLVEYLQADVSREDSLDKVFTPPAGKPPFGLVVNLAAETRFAMPDVVYEQHIVNLRKHCAAKARQYNPDKYIEVSTAQVYTTENKRPAKESDASVLKPWTTLARHHLAAERNTAAVKGLNHLIVRLPNVYGPGDVHGLMPRIACAAAYEYCENEMQLLWGEEMRMHTVHVQDVAAALWYLFCMGEVGGSYNIVDDNDTTQGKFNSVLEKVFKVRTGFLGSMLSQVAQIKLDEMAEEANQGHLETWMEMCNECKVFNTPLTVYVDKELLVNRPVCVDGSKLKALGFEYSCPQPTAELIRECIAYWEQQGKFPRKR